MNELAALVAASYQVDDGAAAFAVALVVASISEQQRERFMALVVDMRVRHGDPRTGGVTCR